MFQFAMLVYQRVYPINIPLNHYKVPLNHHNPMILYVLPEGNIIRFSLELLDFPTSWTHQIGPVTPRGTVNPPRLHHTPVLEFVMAPWRRLGAVDVCSKTREVACNGMHNIFPESPDIWWDLMIFDIWMYIYIYISIIYVFFYSFIYTDVMI